MKNKIRTKDFIERLNNPLNRQISLFLVVGVVCYLISVLLLMFFVEVAAIEVNLANLIASVLTILISYFLNVKFIFQSGKYRFFKEFIAFLAFSLMGLGINVTLMYILTKYTTVWYVISKTIVTVAVAVFNFSTRKWVIFKN